MLYGMQNAFELTIIATVLVFEVHTRASSIPGAAYNSGLAFQGIQWHRPKLNTFLISLFYH